MIARDTQRSQHTCPQCGGPVVEAPEAVLPFCSRRCQQVDLNRWLGEEYGVPHERGLDDLEEELDGSTNDDTDTSYGAY